MTTVTQVLLTPTTQLGSSDASVYTAPTNTTAKIGRAIFASVTSSAVTIYSGITTGGALGASNQLLQRSLAGYETYVSPELAGAVIVAGSQIHAYASASTSVNFTVSGLTIV